jgi:hypothetical protein
MTFNIAVIQPIGALIAGVLILLVPRLLNYVVAIYLMATGIIGLWPRLFRIETRRSSALHLQRRARCH